MDLEQLMRQQSTKFEQARKSEIEMLKGSMAESEEIRLTYERDYKNLMQEYNVLLENINVKEKQVQDLNYTLAQKNQ